MPYGFCSWVGFFLKKWSPVETLANHLLVKHFKAQVNFNDWVILGCQRTEQEQCLAHYFLHRGRVLFLILGGCSNYELLGEAWRLLSVKRKRSLWEPKTNISNHLFGKGYHQEGRWFEMHSLRRILKEGSFLWRGAILDERATIPLELKERRLPNCVVLLFLRKLREEKWVGLGWRGDRESYYLGCEEQLS